MLPFLYGYHPKENDDPMVKSADLGMSAFSSASEVGAFLVDSLPIRMSSLSVRFHHLINFHLLWALSEIHT